MKQFGAMSGIVILATGLLGFFSGCATEISTSVQSGAAAGTAVHGQKLLTTQKEFADANHHLTYEGKEFFRIDAAIPRDNRYFYSDDFMEHCMARCEQGDQPGYDQHFCHSYCSCTSQEFRDNIPFQHLMAFGLGQETTSQRPIHEIIGKCATQANAQQHKPPRPMMEPGGMPQSNTNSVNPSR